MQDRVVQYIFVLLLFLLGVIVALWMYPQPEGIIGLPHPEIKGMLIGPKMDVFDDNIHLMHFLFGLLNIVILLYFILLGAIRRGALGKIRYWFFSGAFLYLVTYTLTFFSNLRYLREEHHLFFGGWPLPTAWMMYAMWFTPLIILIGYIVTFRDSIISEDDELEFATLIKLRLNKKQGE